MSIARTQTSMAALKQSKVVVSIILQLPVACHNQSNRRATLGSWSDLASHSHVWGASARRTAMRAGLDILCGLAFKLCVQHNLAELFSWQERLHCWSLVASMTNTKQRCRSCVRYCHEMLPI